MSKVVWQDGRPHRYRRGKLVEIPPEWFGKIPHKQKQRRRQQKLDHGRYNASKPRSRSWLWETDGWGLLTRQEKKALLNEREQLDELFSG